jgi:tetratricopeptide (TPR) repeat protein
MANSVKKAASLIILLLVSVLSFRPALDNGFTNWDDEELLTQNILVRDISWGNVQKMFGSTQTGTYVPLTILSYSVECSRWGLDPRGYHATNMALHSLNACLVLWLLYLLGAGWWPAFAAALLWAVHPLRVESVAWVTERKDVLYVFFFLWSLICYIAHLKKKRWAYYLLSFLFFAASGLSKGMAAVLPMVLLLTDYLITGRLTKSIWLKKIPFFAVAAAFIFAGFWAQRPGGFNPEYAAYNFGQRVIISGHNLIFYLAKTAWPAKLSALYPYPLDGGGVLPWTFWAAFLAAIGVAIGAAAVFRISPAVGWGAWFFLLCLAPVLQLIGLLGPAIAADRYTYLPSVGLAFLLALGLGKADQILAGHRRAWRRTAAAGILTLTAILSVLTWQRSRVWKDSRVLWDDVITKYPKAAVAYNNRGKYFSDQGLLERALGDYNTALQLQPGYFTALGNRALLYIQAGDCDRAVIDLDQAIAINPLDSRNINNRGALYVKQGNLERALACLNTALEINPDYVDARYNRGVLYLNFKDYRKSLDDLSRVLTLNPYHAKAYLKRAMTYLGTGEPEKAISDAEKALSLEPSSAVGHNILGLAYRLRGEYTKSLAEYNRALEINPAYAEAHNNMALLFFAQHDYKASWEHLAKAQQLGYKPDTNLVLSVKRMMK